MQQFEEQDYTKKFDLSLWKKILRYAKDSHKDLIRLAVCMSVSAGCWIPCSDGEKNKPKSPNGILNH